MQITPPVYRFKLNNRINYTDKHYFKRLVEMQSKYQDKKLAPHICCNCCRTSFLFWLGGEQKQMSFSVTMVSREQSHLVIDCYFCMKNIRGFFRKSKSKISYHWCNSAIRPVSHKLDSLVPQSPIEKEYTLSVNEYASADQYLKLRRMLLSQNLPFNTSFIRVLASH